jgi:hypothetical protein
MPSCEREPEWQRFGHTIDYWRSRPEYRMRVEYEGFTDLALTLVVVHRASNREIQRERFEDRYLNRVLNRAPPNRFFED